MMKVRATICNECPFRRESLPGWLGANNPEDFVQNALADNSLACHTMVNQTLTGSAWVASEEAAPRCRGALTLARNVCKLPRSKEAVEIYRTVAADRKLVFSTSKEFVEYHGSAIVKSWEF